MPKLTHEQFDEKVEGLAATYTALSKIDFMPDSLTNGVSDNSILYGSRKKIYADDTFCFDLTRGVKAGLERLRFDIGCWGRLTHDSSVFIDEVGPDERLKTAGILAMMTAPDNEEKFNEVALDLYKLLDTVVQGNPVTVVRPGGSRYTEGRLVDDIQVSGPNKGRIQAIFENGHISDRVISIWSDRPEKTYSDTLNDKGFFPTVVYPSLNVNLIDLAQGKVQIQYPQTSEIVA